MPQPTPAPRTVAPDAPLFIVFNSGSGAKNVEAFNASLEAVIGPTGRKWHLRTLDGSRPVPDVAKDAVADAKAAGGVVVAAGGDGTLNAVAAATLGSGCPFGALPQGTFNYFGRAQGIPLDNEGMLRNLLGDTAWPVQVGLVNGRPFLVNASLGLYPQLLEDREGYKQRFGRNRFVALVAGIATLLRQHRQLRLNMTSGDQQQRAIRTPTLFVGNNPLQLEQIGMPQAPALEQGLLAAIVLKPVRTRQLLWLLARGLMGQLGEADSVEGFTFRTLTVKPSGSGGRRRAKVATDGEIVWMDAPLQFTVSPEPLYLIKPAVAGPAA